MKILCSIFILLIFWSCNNDSNNNLNTTKTTNTEGFWELSKFNIQEDLIDNNAPIRLMYVSSIRGNLNTDYFLHIMAATNKGLGDTINILTTYANKFGKDDGNKLFEFVNLETTSYDTEILMNFLLEETNIESVSDSNTTINVPSFSSDDYIKRVKAITKVLRDPNFDYIADNSFPTVIGSIKMIGDIE